MTSEATLQGTLRLAAAAHGHTLWRNNNGACLDKTGRMIRYGLGNDSKKLNEAWKSSDLIGITRFTIGPEHVGTTVGIFTAVEVKAPDWHMTPGDKRARAQLAFIDTVRKAGGIGLFATSLDDYESIFR
jgi:hypothetical protein